MTPPDSVIASETPMLEPDAALTHPEPAGRRLSLRRPHLRRPSRTSMIYTLLRIASPVALIGLWQLSADQGWTTTAELSPPAKVWQTGVQLFNNGQLLDDVGKSLERVLLGLAIGGSVAIILGLISGLSRLGESLVDPPLQMLRTMPSLGTAPLLVIWLGIDEGIKVGLVAIAVLFPLYINLHRGIRSIDHRYRELAAICGASRRQVIRDVILPGAMPSLLVGLRLSLGIAWLALVIGEEINANGGIGYLISQGQNALQTNLIILALVLYAILGLLMEGVVRIIEVRVLRWRRGFLG